MTVNKIELIPDDPKKYDPPEEIWLSPFCYECYFDADKLWAEDDIFDNCCMCNRSPVKYKMCED